jgi:NADH-ubiquinone oxidoreductase chain 5
MAAPTPISALVHSSTLVTSGLFLIMRYSYFFYRSYLLIKLLFLIRLFTSLYRGFNCLVEKDLKKIIALSTLSHLGFISLAFRAGLLNLAFFHLLSHALFKSLLFVRIGDIIVNFHHSQDNRIISSGIAITPFSSLIMRLRLLNLLGLTNLRGFYSKDLILEFFLINKFSFILYIFLAINVIFTFYYTFFLITFSFSIFKLPPLSYFYKPKLLYLYSSLSLFIFSLFFGFIYKEIILDLNAVILPFFLKLLPQYLIGLVLFFNITLIDINVKFFDSFYYYFSSMLFLHTFLKVVVKNLFFMFMISYRKTFELGFLKSHLNHNFNLINSLRLKFYKMLSFSSFLVFLYLFLLIIIVV